MNGIKNVGSVSLPSKMHVEGATNTLGVFQKNGRQFVRLSGEAGAESVQPQRSASRASAPTYEGIVTEIKEQIKTSATSRPLLDRIRDPRNHTAKTQVLQLVQLAAREGPNGAAMRALRRLAGNFFTRPLLASALASGIGGPPWVAERNMKIGAGALNMECLAPNAVWVCIQLGTSPEGGISPFATIDNQKAVQMAFLQLKNHGVFENKESSFWWGLQALKPQERLEFLQMTKTCGVLESSSLKPSDIAAGQLGAPPEEYWDAMLQARPISVEGLMIDSYESLKAQILSPLQHISGSAGKIDAAIAELPKAGDQGNALRHLKVIGAQLDALKSSIASLPFDSAVADVARELQQRAEILGVTELPLTSTKPCADAIETMQRQVLNALKGMYRFILYTAGRGYIHAPNLAERYRNESSVGKSIQDQLEEAIQNVIQNVNRRDHPVIMQFVDKAGEILRLTPESLLPSTSGGT